MMEIRSRPPLDALTGLRFLAAGHVAIYHFGRKAFADSPQWTHNLLLGGDAAVSLFFVLSGFVLTYAYAERVEIKRRDFWVARFARLYPMYVLSLVLATPFVVAELRTMPTTTALMRAVAWGGPVFSMTQAWLWQTANKWNFPAWSLSAEAFFYLLFPVLLPRLPSLDSRRTWLAVGGLWASLLAAPLVYLLFDLDGVTSVPTVSDGPWLSTIAYNPLLHLPEFVIGMLVGLSFVRHQDASGWSPRRVCVLTFVAAGVSLSLACVSNLFPVPLLHNGLFAPLFAALVYGLAMGRSPLARLMSWRPLVVLGEASYALYLLQLPIWLWLSAMRDRFAADWLPEPGSGLYLIVYMTTLVSCALLGVHYLERPARAYLRRLLTSPLASSQPVFHPQRIWR